MADDSGTNNAMVPPPPIPPTVTSVLQRGDGSSCTASAHQICSPTAASRGKFTPPLCILQFQPGICSSAISSLYEFHKAPTAYAASSIPINPMDAFALSDLSDDDAPSPKIALPYFTTRKSDNNVIALATTMYQGLERYGACNYDVARLIALATTML